MRVYQIKTNSQLNVRMIIKVTRKFIQDGLGRNNALKDNVFYTLKIEVGH